MIKNYRIRKRVLNEGKYIIEHNATVRETANFFSCSKSNVYIDVTERLEQIDLNLAKKVRKILDANKADRHIRGGIATRKKYLQKNI